MAGDKPGPETLLTDELFGKIKSNVFIGGSYKDIAERSGIPLTTFYTWHSDNYLGLADKIQIWRLQSKLDKADRNIDGILDLSIDDKESLKVVADMSKFVKETLDKPNYSKRVEQTGADGKDLQITVVNYADATPKPEEKE